MLPCYLVHHRGLLPVASTAVDLGDLVVGESVVLRLDRTDSMSGNVDYLSCI
jgi:hypothetical protein